MAELGNDTTKWLAAGAAVAAAAVGAAVYNNRKARKAEARTPPVGQFAEVDGTRIHYLRRGQGPRVVLIHGNGVMVQDWLVSGVFDALAETCEVIAIDRPGFGYSERPRARLWTAEAQADLNAKLLDQVGFEPDCVVGHSFGALVAAALGLNHPGTARRLVLLAGYYFPQPRPDLLINAGPGVPVWGDFISHTINPIAGSALMPVAEKQLFYPADVSATWKESFPVPMILRPSQVRATGEDFALAIPSTAQIADRYPELTLPVTIMAGPGDKIVGFEKHSERLHGLLPHSRLVRLEDAGHMVHWSAQDRVLSEIAAAVSA